MTYSVEAEVQVAQVLSLDRLPLDFHDLHQLTGIRLPSSNQAPCLAWPRAVTDSPRKLWLANTLIRTAKYRYTFLIRYSQFDSDVRYSWSQVLSLDLLPLDLHDLYQLTELRLPIKHFVYPGPLTHLENYSSACVWLLTTIGILLSALVLYACLSVCESGKQCRLHFLIDNPPVAAKHGKR